ncbi:MAG: primase [Firmicutes bacterium]|nr:primase [Bacillota bacterium]
MAIPSRFIDELVARCDIVDVVSDYVTLNQKGGSYWGLCPFHGERNPSFHVVPDRQMYHCFGCGKGGGVISFIMELENLPYPEAIRHLSKVAGMEFPEEEGDDQYRKRKKRMLALNKEAARFFHGRLYDPTGQKAMSYLHGRGLSKGTLTRFGIGFAPDGWDNLLIAMQGAGYEKSELIDAGLAVSGKQGKIYDRFRGRVMFPIIDLRGDVIGFGGRVLEDGTPKYLNSPDTMVFNKSQNLFALNLAKNSKIGRLILTEGYMDTIALYQVGIDCAVASLGTAFTPGHAKLLARFTQEVVIAYDSDEAGVSAAQRAIPLLEKSGLKVKVLRIQGAKDPDEYIKTFGRESFVKLLDRSEDHVEYSLAQLQQRYNLEEDGQKIEFARAAAQMVASLPSPVEREVYAGRVAQLTGIEKAAILQEVNRAYKKQLGQAKKKQERRDMLPVQQVQPQARELRYDNIRSARAEEGVLSLLLTDETLFDQVDGLAWEQFSSPFLGKVFALLRERHEEGNAIHLGALAGVLAGEEMSQLSAILSRGTVHQNSRRAMADYKRIIETEALTKAGETDEVALLAARETYQKIKGMGDGLNGR